MTAQASEITVFPVSVLMRRTLREHRGWSYPAWEVAGLLPADDEPATPGGGVVHEDGPATDYLWRGLRVRLLRSNAETYWYNLTGTHPRAFVICRSDGEGVLVPLMVTLDQDEATRQIEGDGEVFEAAIPERIYDGLEQFVMTHYRPEPRRRKRRRDDEST